MELAALVPQVLTSLFLEIVDGPPGDMAFIVNPGDPGLLASLAALPASAASARPNGRSSVAAHVQHLRYGFTLLNRWAGGDQNAFADASFAESWSHQQVNDEEWHALRQALAEETRQWLARLETSRDWDAVTLSGFVSSVAHTAYHLGAFRQLVPAAAGPVAKD
jgi:glutathione S-transferase